MVVIQTLGYIAIVAHDSCSTMKFCLKCLPLKKYKIGNITFVVLMHDNTYNHFHSLGIIECIVHELVRARTKAPPFRPTWALNTS
jgi:hypothetical protein